jgi:hypothetical protein
MTDWINLLVDGLVKGSSTILMPLMLLAWVGAMVLKVATYYTVKREEWFSREFEKRAIFYLDEDPHTEPRSFFVIMKRLLERTYYELFETRAVMKRRRLDYVMTPSDRLFLIQHGVARLVKDTLREIKFLKKSSDEHPDFLSLSKSVLQNNPCFTRVLGVVPAGTLNDVLNLIPGLFIIGGVFGTFLGIMEALPMLSRMDLTDPDGTKQVMDGFLLKVAFSMATSILGIFLSVSSTIWFAFFSPEKLFMRIVDRFERVLFRVWIRCDSNQLPEQIENFDENRDPIEALAEVALAKELQSKPRFDEESYEPKRRSGLPPPPSKDETKVAS